jgi:hypothetical protein
MGKVEGRQSSRNFAHDVDGMRFEVKHPNDNFYHDHQGRWNSSKKFSREQQSHECAKPTASVGQCVWPTFPANSRRRGTIPPELIGNPKTLPSCPNMMLRAIPFRKPTKMGLDKKSGRAPNLMKLAPMQSIPARKASNTDRDWRLVKILITCGKGSHGRGYQRADCGIRADDELPRSPENRISKQGKNA